MADAGVALGGMLAQECGQIVDAAGFLAQVKLIVVQDAKAGGIVTTIFQTTQAFEDNAGGGLGANVANDATHSMFCLLKSCDWDSTGPAERAVCGGGESQGVDFDAFVFYCRKRSIT
jgi:hypothetical protein